MSRTHLPILGGDVTFGRRCRQSYPDGKTPRRMSSSTLPTVSPRHRRSLRVKYRVPLRKPTFVVSSGSDTSRHSLGPKKSKKRNCGNRQLKGRNHNNRVPGFCRRPRGPIFLPSRIVGGEVVSSGERSRKVTRLQCPHSVTWDGS